MTSESPLAALVPLWRTIREGGVTALVTPALDYVGGLELGTLDVRFAGDDQIASIGEALRSLVASLDDETTLHFIQRVEEGAEEDIREYELTTAGAEGAALRLDDQYGVDASTTPTRLHSQGHESNATDLPPVP